LSASIVDTVDFPAPIPPVNPTLIMGEAWQATGAAASRGRGWSRHLHRWAMIVR
jgi:hypothetical protein